MLDDYTNRGPGIDIVEREHIHLQQIQIAQIKMDTNGEIFLEQVGATPTVVSKAACMMKNIIRIVLAQNFTQVKNMLQTEAQETEITVFSIQHQQHGQMFQQHQVIQFKV